MAPVIDVIAPALAVIERRTRRAALLDHMASAYARYHWKRAVNDMHAMLTEAGVVMSRPAFPIMGATFSDPLEDDVLDHILGGPDYTRIATTSIGLATAVTGLEAGNATSEVSTGGGTLYDRVDKTNNNTNWPAASAGAKSNGTAITFPTAGASWGGGGADLTHAFIANSGVPGTNDIIMWGALTVPKPVESGDTAEFAVGDFDVTLD